MKKNNLLFFCIKKVSLFHNPIERRIFMARHRVEICGVNTADIEVLSSEEMTNLFKEYKKGNLSAKEHLIKGNLKLVLSIIKKFNNRTDNMDDLFQIGCVGLIKAIDNFDLGHEVKFSTYAVPMIEGEIKRYLRDNNSVRIARSIKDLAYRALRVKEELTNSMGKEPPISLIAQKLGVTDFEIVTAFDAMKESVSIFEPIYNDGGDVIYLSDQLEDKKGSLYSFDMHLALREAIDKLSKKEKMILNERYIVGKTQVELAQEIGISQAQISRIEKGALENIKKMME